MIQWGKEGDKLILVLDGNEDMKDGQLAQMLQNPDLDMKDIIKLHMEINGPATFSRGSRQIDGAWITPDMTFKLHVFLHFSSG